MMIEAFYRLFRHFTVLGLVRQYLAQLATVLVWLDPFVNNRLKVLARVGHHHLVSIGINHRFNKKQVRQM